MADPFTTSVATAVATGATAALSDGARALVTRLVAVIRERFRRQSSDHETLEAAISGAKDPEAVRRLAELINERMRDDPAFAQQLRSLWSDIAADDHHRAEITNLVSGPVHGSVVQARDVQGGITLHGPPRPD